MEAVQLRGGLEHHRPADRFCGVLVAGPGRLQEIAVAELVEMLGDLRVSGVEHQGTGQGSAGGGVVCADAVFGRGLDQSRDRVAAGDRGGQPVIGVRGVERSGLLVALQSLFKLPGGE